MTRQVVLLNRLINNPEFYEIKACQSQQDLPKRSGKSTVAVSISSQELAEHQPFPFPLVLYQTTALLSYPADPEPLRIKIAKKADEGQILSGRPIYALLEFKEWPPDFEMLVQASITDLEKICLSYDTADPDSG